VANRFLPQQSLIGPLLFPVYRFILKIVALCYLLPGLAIGLSLLILIPSYRLEHYGPSWVTAYRSIWSWLWYGAFVAFGTITLVFTILERVQARTRFLENWNPRRLPPVRDLRLIPRLGSAIELAVNLIFLLWWAANARTSELPLGPDVRVILAPQWSWFFWSYLILATINMAAACVNLLQPYWTPIRAGLRLALNAAGSILFCALMRANVVTRIVAADFPVEKQEEYAHILNHWLVAVFPVMVLVGLLIVGIGSYRLIRVCAAIRAGERAAA